MLIKVPGAQEVDVSLYDRINVLIGNQELTARPVDFVLDSNQNVIGVLRYETTCPDCGGLVLFDKPEKLDIDVSHFVKCSVCLKEPIKVINKLKIEKVNQSIAKPRIDLIVPWVNPIELDIFNPEQLEFV